MTRNRLFKNADGLLAAVFSPLTLYYSIFPKRGGPPAAPGKILVSKLCCFGDGVLSLYALRSLKEKFPAAHITVLAGARNAEIFERSALIDRVVRLPLSGTEGFREFGKLFRVLAVFYRLRRERYDAFLDFNLYFRFITLLGPLCGNKFSAGFSMGGSRAKVYHHQAERPRDEAEWRAFYRLLSPYGILPPASPAPLNFRVEAGERAAAVQWASRAPAGVRKVAVVPGASPNWPENRWPLSHFSQLLRKLNDEKPSVFFIVGSSGEKPLAEALVKTSSGMTVIDLTGETPFPVMVALALQMDLWVSNDTGPMHLAAALGRPTLGIFGPTNEKKWSPPGRFRALAHPGCRCRPCNYLSQMPSCNHQACLEKISPDMAAAAAAALAMGAQP